MTNQSPEIYALLIGIDCYMPNRLPDGSSYGNLGGCVRDINRVEAFLKDFKQVPDSQILKLTASPSKENESIPTEPPEQLATRNNIIEHFIKIGEVATPGAQVYIHYSGHGGRAKTVFEDIKGAAEKDEGLVPTDIGNSAGQYLRDLELAHLLEDLSDSDKDLTVTIVLDCCHSGGGTRGDVAIRGLSAVDDKPLSPNHQWVASPEDLQKTWDRLQGANSRGLTAGGLPDSEKYVVLAGCREHELSYEFAFEPGERSGVLTYWLLDTLRRPNPGLTYKDVYDRVNAKVHSQFRAQTPLLIGAGDRLLFGSESGETVFAVPVMDVEESEGELTAVLGAGQANGITKGAEFAIYPRGSTDLISKEARVATAKVTERGATSSVCRVERIEGKAKVEAGDQAVQIALSPILVRQVGLLPTEETANAPTKQALAQVRAAITQYGKGWVEVAETQSESADEESVDYFVEVSDKGTYNICETGGQVFENMRPVLEVSDEDAAEKLVKRLVQLAKYQAAITIDNTDSDSPLSGKLSVEWLGTSDIYGQGDPIPKKSQLVPIVDKTKPTVKVGNYIFLAIRNDATVPLNVAVLNFEADWAVEQIHPKRATENFITIEPGKTEKLPLSVTVEGERNEAENTLKIFATKDQANFRCLELPSLDQPPKAKTRSANLNPLESLLSAIEDEQPKSRRIRVAASPSRDWIAVQRTLTITK